MNLNVNKKEGAAIMRLRAQCDQGPDPHQFDNDLWVKGLSEIVGVEIVERMKSYRSTTRLRVLSSVRDIPRLTR